MKTIKQVYNKLSPAYDSQISYDECSAALDVATLSGVKIRAFEEDEKLFAELYFEGQTFRQQIGSMSILFVFIKELLDGKVTLVRIGETLIRIDGFADFGLEKKKRFSVGRRIFSIILGVAAVLFFAPFMLYGAEVFLESDFSSRMWLCDCSPFFALAAGLVIGVALIHHGLAKVPLPFTKIWSFGFGTALAGISITEIMITLSGEMTGTTADYIGVSILFFIVLFMGILFIWLGLRRKDKSEYTHSHMLKRIPLLLSQEEIELLLKTVKEKTLRESFVISGDTETVPELFDSKLGGLPYWDMAIPYPETENGVKMPLLAQINLSQLPENNSLPGEGILQFFLAPDYEDDLADSDFKVVFHRNVNTALTEDEVEKLDIYPVFYVESDDERAISFEKEMVYIDGYDAKSREVLHETARELNIRIDETLGLDELLDEDEEPNSRLLGYCCDHNFQHDERSTLLLYLEDTEDIELLGINGVYSCKFFVRDEDLYNMNFEDVRFEMD